MISLRGKIGFGAVGLLTLLLVPIRSERPLSTGAYSQAVTTDSAVVAIVSRKPRALALRVRCDTRIVAEIEHAASRRHEFRVDGLRPGALHEFEVVDSFGRVVDAGRFLTRSDVDTTPVRFVVVGDTGGQPWWEWARRSALFHDLEIDEALEPAQHPMAIGRAIAAERPDFWLHVGDVVYPRGEQRHYRPGFFRPFAEALRTSVCYPVLGNHDVMVGDGAAFLENFVYPGDDERNFSFRDGPLRVIAIDLTRPDVRPATSDHPSIRFLRRELDRATEPWIVVVSHFPVHSAYREAPRADLLAHYLPLCEEFGVDMILAGHDHNYQRFDRPGSVPEIVTGGGGKSLYDIRYEPEGLVVAKRDYHYCTAEIRAATLTWRAIGLDGRELDAFVIEKSATTVVANDERAARIRAIVK